MRLGCDATFADASAAVCTRFCGRGLPVGLIVHPQHQRCHRACREACRGLGLPSPYLLLSCIGAQALACRHAASCFWLPAPHLTNRCGDPGQGRVRPSCCRPLKPHPSAASSRPNCCVLQAVGRCLHLSNLQDKAAGAWAGAASSEADSSSAAGDHLSVGAASQGTAGWAPAGPELWPLDDSEKLRVRFTGCHAECMLWCHS